MAIVPVICEKCESFYSASVLEGAILGDTKLGGNPIPCPYCGDIGYVIEGLYSTIGNAIQIIASSVKSRDQLELFYEKLQALNYHKAEPSEFQKILKNEIPEIKSVSDTLPQTRSELYAFIAVLLTAISILISTLSQFSEPSNFVKKEDVNQIVIKAVEKVVNDRVNKGE